MTKRNKGLFVEIAGKDGDKVNILTNALLYSATKSNHAQPLEYSKIVVLENPKWHGKISILDFFNFYNDRVLPHIEEGSLVIIRNYIAEISCSPEHLNRTSSLVLSKTRFGKPDICIVTEEDMYSQYKLTSLIGELVDKIVLEEPLQNEHQIPETSIKVINKTIPKTGFSKLLVTILNLFRR